MESTNEKIVETLQEVVSRLAALETTVAGLTDKKKPQPEGISFDHLGGKKIHHFVSEKRTEPISFEHLGGRKVGQHIATPEESKDENSTE